METTRAQLENARWDLTQTTVLAPGNGTMVNVMLRPGFFVAGMPFNEVMTFVDDEYQIFALFGQNELHQVEPGNEAEITLDTYPGRIIKAHVDSVIWAQGQGQLDASGDLPRTAFVRAARPVPGEARRRRSGEALFLAAGARGSAAIYTEHLALVHIIRKVLLRVRRISTTSSSSTASASGTDGGGMASRARVTIAPRCTPSAPRAARCGRASGRCRAAA